MFIVNLSWYKTYTSSLLTIILLTSYNITLNEIRGFRRMPYLMKNRQGEFFNPFDKGFLKNWQEAFYF